MRSLILHTNGHANGQINIANFHHNLTSGVIKVFLVFNLVDLSLETRMFLLNLLNALEATLRLH